MQQGSCKFLDRYGHSHEGQWVSNHRLADGSRYDGLWRADKPDGYGRLHWFGDYFDFATESREGWGSSCVKSHGERYEGEWKEDNRHGLGELGLPSGEMLKGEFRNGVLGNAYFFLLWSLYLMLASLCPGPKDLVPLTESSTFARQTDRHDKHIYI